MAALTKKDAQRHRQACALLAADRDLTEDEKEFVLQHWQESSTAANRLEGAFFTPLGLARDLAVELHGCHGPRFLDLGAGIGHLAFANRRRFAHCWNGEPCREFVCVEKNPAYVAVGRQVMPEATWICADILDLLDMVDRLGGPFDVAISNPPFGVLPRTRNAPGYRGRRFEYHVIAVAAALARYGVFLVPQTSAPFRYSGYPTFLHNQGDVEYQRFTAATGLVLKPSCGIDATVHDDQWRGVRPRVEIVTCDLTDRRPPVAPGGQLALVP
ncbi:hypothetical protein GCM10012275_42660 [Longimycelium tulufanense]|uniref:Methyltransferase n=1 Tax=Longimycelium tulufanense TaxID=907463 RepID=A0A8J3CHI9_9PSEU|nr:methyltransferase [Longimycelium tulufanense]GGM67515.1 hypothetical protein GCM10012275_42660 [Longimycelium tulufanense]